MPANYPVLLTQLETLYLSDALSMFTQGPPDALPGQASPYPNLLLKICGAVLESEQQKAPVNVHLSLNELWMIRESAKTSVVVGNERVGLSLLLKVYSGIRALTAESDMQSVVNTFGEVAVDEPGKSEYAAKLEQIKGDHEDSESGERSEDGYQNDPDRSGKQPRNTGKNRPDHDTATAA